MKRNGHSIRMGVMPSEDSEPAGHRTFCRECEAVLPRGCDRPFCVEHSPYAYEVRKRAGISGRIEKPKPEPKRHRPKRDHRPKHDSAA